MKITMRHSLITALISAFGSIAAADTVVSFNTNLGSFQARLYDDTAPITVANFMRYVDAHLYDQSLIHRSVPGFVIQGGGYYDLGSSATNMVPTFDPIPLENPNGNYRGTLGMARTADPNSARSQWFINLQDNSQFLDAASSLNEGYAVFGEIIGDGMTVVDAIASLPTVEPIDTYYSYGSPPLLNGSYVRMSITEVPEPSTRGLVLLGLTACGVGLSIRRVHPR